MFSNTVDGILCHDMYSILSAATVTRLGVILLCHGDGRSRLRISLLLGNSIGDGEPKLPWSTDRRTKKNKKKSVRGA